MGNLRLGISPCPNDVYIFSGILLGRVSTGELRFDVDYEDVETLNTAAQQGAYDVVKISYANYIRCQQHYALMDTGGALGYGCGPLLLANGERLQADREVLIPGAFTTANFLLDFYLQHPVPKRALSFEKLYAYLCEHEGAQGVVIHEKRFTYEQDGLTKIADLGEHWEQETGMPIPLGAIALHRDLINIQPAIETHIRQSLAWAQENDAEAFALCQQYAQDLTPEVIRAHIALYVNDFSRDVGEQGRAAIDFFLRSQQHFLERAKNAKE
jgi:1,4-dihydroxy-6-naphthoate synthase